MSERAGSRGVMHRLRAERIPLVMFWVEFALAAIFLLVYGFSGALVQWWTAFSLAVTLVLLVSVSLAFVMWASGKIPLWTRSLSGLPLFGMGLGLLAYSLAAYSLGRPFSNGVAPFLAPGAGLSIVALFLMLVHADQSTRRAGTYGLWLLGLLFVLFMPLNDLASGSAGYSPQDLLVGTLGFAVSVVGASAYVIGEFQRRFILGSATVGDAKYITRKYDEAIENYDRALVFEPENPRLWYSKGAALLHLGHFKGALEAFDKCLRYDPDERAAWDGKGLALRSLDRHGEALECHDKALTLGESAITWNNKGNTLERLNRHEEALAAYGKATSLRPEYAVAWYNRGLALQGLDRNEQALEYLEQVIKLRPKFAMGLLSHGKALRRLGREREALISLDKAVQLRPNLYAAWLERTEVVQALGGDPQDTLSAPLPAGAEPGMYVHDAELELEIERWHGDAIELVQNGKPKEGLQLLDKILRRDPHNAFAMTSKALVQARMGKGKSAVVTYGELLRVKPEWVGPRFSRALLLARGGEFSGALEDLEQALDRQPGYADAWSLKGVLFGIVKRYGDALDCFDRSIAIEPSDPEVWQARGKVLVKLGDQGEALVSYRKALELDPLLGEALEYVRGHEEMLNTAQGMVQEGAALAKARQYQEAISKLDGALDMRPDLADAWYLKGVVLGILREYGLAAEAFEKVLELKGDDTEALAGLGKTRIKTGDFTGAETAYRRLVGLLPESETTWLGLGHALILQERYAEALDSLNRALDIDPGTREAPAYLELALSKIEAREAPPLSQGSHGPTE